ncbi:MAG: hypothetical protein ACODAG_05090 [Myxococcota bacterium]
MAVLDHAELRHNAGMHRLTWWLGLACTLATACGPAPRAASSSAPTSPTPAERRPPAPSAETRTEGAPSGPRLGVSWPAFHAGDYTHPKQHLERLHRVGFRVVTLVPTYGYVGLNDVDHRNAPSFEDQANAIATALEMGLKVVVKPHLDPPLYQPGFDAFRTTNPSWRAHCPWRGYFDVDPASDAYLRGLMMPTLEAIERALDRAGSDAAPVRLDLGSELMNSTVHQPGRWAELAARMRKSIRARGLQERVQLSHNFSHHVQIPQDFVLRMSAPERESLGRYVRSLDAVGLSQYMDLTVAMPAGARGTRLPTEEEVADALLQHEHAFRRDILEHHLGLAPQEVPPIHIGEFGIGLGGLTHPNLWQGEIDEQERRALREAVTRGHAGLLDYLGRNETTVHSAVLWVTGGTYDVFGWMKDASAISEVRELYEAFFARRESSR